MKKKTIILFAAAFAISFTVGALASSAFNEYLFPTTGDISDVTLTFTWQSDDKPVTVIDWGVCQNSTPYDLEPINITNTSNVNVTLALEAKNQVGIMALSLTWNYTGTLIQPNESVIVELTQTVTAAGPYSYDTSIIGTEAPP